ncbi:MAG: PIN domain nuclease [SAR324 cluster bacterium]|nr:PIN domain nuclease [SAR324 cluster bacterium]
MILVDTSVLIDFFKKNKTHSTARFKELVKKEIPFGITSQIFQEVLQGTKSDKDYNRLKDYLETQIFYHPQDPVKSFADAAQLYRECRKQGVTPRSTIDCLIAQVAIEHNLSLLHNDKDFDIMAGVINLRIY